MIDSSIPEKNVSAVGVQLGEPASWALPPATWTLIEVTWPSERPGTATRASMPPPSSFSVTVPDGDLRQDELAVVVDGGDERRADDAHLQARLRAHHRPLEDRGAARPRPRPGP